MKQNVIVLAIVTLAVAAMLIAGKRLAPARVAGSAAPAVVTKGAEAPDFALQTLDGKTVKLTDFRGKAVLLNFWATWCAPCKIEMPWLVDLQKQYGPQGLQVLGIAMDDSGPDAIRKFDNEMGVNYIVLQGKNAVGDEYGAEGLPTSYFVDRSGKIVNETVGLVDRGEIENNVKLALAAAPGPAVRASAPPKNQPQPPPPSAR